MRVCVLGPLEVVDGGAPVTLGGPKERRLLAALALQPGQVVAESRLVDVLWGDDPPRTATKTLQNYVLRLRKALSSGSGGLSIVTVPPGYVLRGAPEAFDSLDVVARLSEARQAARAGDHGRAAELLEEALALWRGPSLVEFADEPFAMAEAARLDELRQAALDERIDAELALGRHGPCVAELEALLAENPLRERRWGQLMVALYRSGRQADALRAYQRARTLLGEELGIDPGPDLRRLEQAVLDQDPSLDLPPAAAPGAGVAAAAGHGHAPDVLPPGMAAPPDSLFVGRREPLARLERAWEEACGGRARVVVVRGEAGIGKTSVARAIAAHAQGSGGLVLHGRCDEEEGIPYQPFAEALRWHASHCPPDWIETHMGALGADLVRLVPELAARGVAAPAPADPAVERYRLFEAVVELLGVMSEPTPLLFVLDDLHWAARSTLLLLRHIVRSGRLGRVLVVVTCRDAGPEVPAQITSLLAELHREPGVEILNLGGLEEAESVELVQARAGEDLDAGALAFVRTLHTETGGNPFFLGEMLRHLVESGTVYREPGGRWRSHYRLEELELPDGVRGVVNERLGRLSPDANRTLAVGAVAGATFSLDLLERIPEATAGGDLLDALDEAVAAQVLVEVPGPGRRYTFLHALLRQVLRQGLTAGRRARLHQRIGEAYEALGTTDTHLVALAHHFTEAGDVERATRYSLAAGLQAMGTLAFEVAVSILERGVACIDGALDPDRARRADLLLALADARRLVGDVDGARKAASRAADDARAIDSPTHLAGAAMLQTGLGMAGRSEPAVRALCEEALAALGPAASGLRVQVLARLALQLALWEGEGPAGSALAEEALRLARTLGEPGALHTALFARAVALMGSHHVDERRRLGEELMAMAGQLGNPRLLVRGLRIRARARLELGDIPGFDADFERLEHEGRTQRDWLTLSEVTRWRGLRALVDGRFSDAEASAGDMLAFAASEPNAPAAELCQRFFLCRERGLVTETPAIAAEAIARFPTVAAFRALLALAHADTANTTEARRLFDELTARGVAALPRDFTWPASLCLLSMVCAALGDAEKAPELSELFAPHAGHLAVIGWGDVCAGAVDRFLGQLEAVQGRWHTAVTRYEAALELESRVAPDGPLVVRTRACLAEALLRRRGPGDEASARELWAMASARARDLGMQAVAGAPQLAGT
ncbi:MAG: BTAD domain-containing putative transcriptional regulator [Acidimicrobiia bacterium]